MSSKKSKDFDRNLDSRAMNKQIEKNLYKASEILKDTSNQIAPIDTGQLRSNVETKNRNFESNVIWEQPYAGKVYEKNKKNPQTTKWIEKGYNKKRNTLERIMREEVVK